MRPHYTTTEFESLISRFEKRVLPKEEWTHEAHLAAAVWYLWHHDFTNAFDLVRENISRHNESVGGINSDTEGYHETITKAWLLITRSFLDRYDFASPVEACNALVVHKSGHMHYLKNFYTKDHLLSRHARKHWVEPDLAPLSIEIIA
jgi:hypothetical protein